MRAAALATRLDLRMLYRFIEDHWDEIRALVQEKGVERGGLEQSEAEVDLAITVFLDQVLDRLRTDAGVPSAKAPPNVRDAAHDHGVAAHATTRSVSDVVFDYGAVCEAIATVAEHHDARITPHEYRTLNVLIDVAVAAALNAYFRQRSESDATERRARLQELGSFSHELRNALNAAMFAFHAMKRGPMPLESHTGRVLERALERLRSLVENSLVEVRLGVDRKPNAERVLLRDLFEELAAMVESDAVRRSVPVEVEVPPDVEIEADRHLLLSALSNLLQNAVKYTIAGGRVWLRGRQRLDIVELEVEDRCGGLPDGKVEELFAPFRQMHADKSGVGLGVSIALRVARMHGGRIDVRSLPGEGCVFAMALPRPAR